MSEKAKKRLIIDQILTKHNYHNDSSKSHSSMSQSEFATQAVPETVIYDAKFLQKQYRLVADWQMANWISDVFLYIINTAHSTSTTTTTTSSSSVFSLQEEVDILIRRVLSDVTYMSRPRDWIEMSDKEPCLWCDFFEAEAVIIRMHHAIQEYPSFGQLYVELILFVICRFQPDMKRWDHRFVFTLIIQSISTSERKQLQLAFRCLNSFILQFTRASSAISSSMIFEELDFSFEVEDIQSSIIGITQSFTKVCCSHSSDLKNWLSKNINNFENFAMSINKLRLHLNCQFVVIAIALVLCVSTKMELQDLMLTENQEPTNLLVLIFDLFGSDESRYVGNELLSVGLETIAWAVQEPVIFQIIVKDDFFNKFINKLMIQMSNSPNPDVRNKVQKLIVLLASLAFERRYASLFVGLLDTKIFCLLLDATHDGAGPRPLCTLCRGISCIKSHGSMDAQIVLWNQCQEFQIDKLLFAHILFVSNEMVMKDIDMVVGAVYNVYQIALSLEQKLPTTHLSYLRSVVNLWTSYFRNNTQNSCHKIICLWFRTKSMWQSHESIIILLETIDLLRECENNNIYSTIKLLDIGFHSLSESPCLRQDTLGDVLTSEQIRNLLSTLLSVMSGEKVERTINGIRAIRYLVFIPTVETHIRDNTVGALEALRTMVNSLSNEVSPNANVQRYLLIIIGCLFQKSPPVELLDLQTLRGIGKLVSKAYTKDEYEVLHTLLRSPILQRWSVHDVLHLISLGIYVCEQQVDDRMIDSLLEASKDTWIQQMAWMNSDKIIRIFQQTIGLLSKSHLQQHTAAMIKLVQTIQNIADALVLIDDREILKMLEQFVSDIEAMDTSDGNLKMALQMLHNTLIPKHDQDKPMPFENPNHIITKSPPPLSLETEHVSAPSSSVASQCNTILTATTNKEFSSVASKVRYYSIGYKRSLDDFEYLEQLIQNVWQLIEDANNVSLNEKLKSFGLSKSNDDGWDIIHSLAHEHILEAMRAELRFDLIRATRFDFYINQLKHLVSTK